MKMDLTQEEQNVILKLRKKRAEQAAAAKYTTHLLKIAWGFAAWQQENGAGRSLSTFCDDFGYEGKKGENISLLYKHVLRIMSLSTQLANE